MEDWLLSRKSPTSTTITTISTKKNADENSNCASAALQFSIINDTVPVISLKFGVR